jgi:hypothetical protein
MISMGEPARTLIREVLVTWILRKKTRLVLESISAEVLALTALMVRLT